MHIEEFKDSNIQGSLLKFNFTMEQYWKRPYGKTIF